MEELAEHTDKNKRQVPALASLYGRHGPALELYFCGSLAAIEDPVLVDVYVCRGVCLCILVYAYRHACVHVCKQTHIYMYTCTYTYIHMYMHISLESIYRKDVYIFCRPTW